MRQAALLLLLLAGCSPIPPAELTASTRDAVVDGTPSSDPRAVALVGRRTLCGEAPMLLCSGALIAGDVVLTAAHCLDVLGVDGQYEVFLGDTLPPGGQGRFVRVAEVAVHPGFVHATHAYDVALLRLARTVDVAPFGLLDGPPAVDESARVLGYGETRNSAQPPGIRREGTTRVQSVRDAEFTAVPSPSMSCTGDSGGPVTVTRGPTELLAGITVSGDFACQAEAVAVRTDAVLADFIRPFLASAPNRVEPGTSLDRLCRDACASNADCPAGLSCEPGDDGRGHCMLRALREGDFGARCTQDSECGNRRCVQIDEEDCRCFAACAPDQGCAVGGEFPALLAAALSLIAVRRRRSAPAAR